MLTMNELELLLLAPNRVTPEDLRAAGYSAARAHIAKQANLSEEVARFAREKNLNDNQIERVVETANQAVFGSLFKTAESKQIEFPVADPRIVRELLRRDDDVCKTASFLDVESAMLLKRNPSPSRDIEQYFGVTKTAELDPELIRREMGRDVLSLMDLKNDLSADLATARDKAKTAAMEMQTKVKQFIDLSGDSPDSISEAITGIARNHTLAKTAMRFLFGDTVSVGLTKTARLINEDHPIVHAYRQYEDSVVDVIAREQVLADVVAQQATVRGLAAQTDRLLGLAAEGRELHKEAAREKRASVERPSLGQRLAEQEEGGGPTHNVSRLVTSPGAAAALGAVAGGGLGALGVYGMRKAPAALLRNPDVLMKAVQFLRRTSGLAERESAVPLAAIIGAAGLGGAAGGATALSRGVHSRAIEGRANMGGGALTKRERALVGMDKEAGILSDITDPIMKRLEGAATRGAKEAVNERIDNAIVGAVDFSKGTLAPAAGAAGAGFLAARAMRRAPVSTPENQPKLAAAAPTFMQRAGTFLKLLKPKNVPDMDYLPGAARSSLVDEATKAFRSSNAGSPNPLQGVDLQDELDRIAAKVPDAKVLESRMKALELLDPKGMKTEYEGTSFGKGMGRAAGMAAIGIPAIVGAHALVDSGDRVNASMKRGSAWKKFTAEHPDLADIPSTKAHFNTLWAIAPNVAQDPAIAGPWLKRVDSMGGRDVGLDVKAVKDVADLQKAIGDAKASRGYAGGSIRSSLMNSLAGSYGGSYGG